MEEVRCILPKKVNVILLLCIILIICGHNVSAAKFLNPRVSKTPPQARLASYASSTLATNFLGLEDLGPHSYKPNLLEKNGIVFTCKAGHIDIAHARKLIDWTAYLASKTFDNLMKNKTEFSYMSKNPSRYYVHIIYPEYWKVLSKNQKESVAYNISIRLGQYLAYTEGTWHEILTWFGYKCIGFIPEFPSAFSWEDTFSNCLGSHIAVLALQDTEHQFDEAATLALAKELQKLGIQSAKAARRAAEEVRGQWFSGNLLVDIKMRNFDIGLDDGFVTPYIVPSFADCQNAEALDYPVPDLAFLSVYGFSARLEIEPHEWEKDKIFKIISGTRNATAEPAQAGKADRIEPAIHFAPIMEYIKKQNSK